MNGREPLSRYAQLSRGIKVVRLHRGDSSDEMWINDIVDSGSTSIADRVATKLDFVAWLGSQCCRTRSIAMDLVRGSGTARCRRKVSLVLQPHFAIEAANCIALGSSSRESRCS